jgi:hypothetical protein
MASATALDPRRVEHIPLERLSAEGMDWNLMKPLPAEPTADGGPREDFEIWTERDGGREALTKPNSLRVALYRHPHGGHVLHLVNYARDVAGAKKLKKSTPDAELPVASPPLWVRIPAGSAIKTQGAKVLTPDLHPDGSPEEIAPEEQTDARGDRWIRVGAISVYRIVDMREIPR